MFIAALHKIAKTQKVPKCPSIDEWINIILYIYIYIYIYIHTHTHTHIHIYNGILAIKQNEILPFATIWMDLQGIMLSEISQTEKDKYCMISLICEI